MFSTTAGVTAAERAERGDDAAQQDHGGVGGVLLDPCVVERQQFVAGRRQPHDAVSVDCAVLVDVAARQLEAELRAELLASAGPPAGGQPIRLGPPPGRFQRAPRRHGPLHHEMVDSS